MTIYLAISFLMLIIGTLLKTEVIEKGRKRFIIFAFFILVIVSGFRAYSVGSDTIAYVDLYKKISYQSEFTLLRTRYEIGFLYFIKLMSRFSEDPTFLLCATSIINIGSVCLFVKKFSKDPKVSLVLYVLFQSYSFQMTGMRQALATSITIFAFGILLDNETLIRKIESLILIFIAISFHTMAAVTLILYVIWVFPMNIKNKIYPAKVIRWTLIMCVLLFLFYNYIMLLVNIFFPKYAFYFSGTWSDSNYVASLLNTGVEFVFLLFGACYIKKDKIEKSELFALWALFFSIIFNALSIKMEIWARVTEIFSIYTSLLWTPAVLWHVQNRKERFIWKSTILIGGFLYMIVILAFRPEWSGVVPYITKWVK